MQKALAEKGLPSDLAYVAMIESGFSSKATSHAKSSGGIGSLLPPLGKDMD